MNNNKPFFSIAIPTYEMHGRGKEFLEFIFNNLDSQSFKDFEVVVSDHSRDDAIEKLCDSWALPLNIKYLKNKCGVGGSSPNINNAIKNCSGEWIKLLFQDDFLFGATALEELSVHIKNNDREEWFVSACEHSSDGYNMTRPHYPHWTSDIHLGNNRISSPSVVTIKNTEHKMYFDEDLIWLMDVEYYKRMHIRYGEPSYLQSINVVNRIWGNRLSDTIPQSIKIKETNTMRIRYDNN